MIQRLQSLYLVLAAAAAGLVAFFSLGEILVMDGLYQFDVYKLVLVSEDTQQVIENYFPPLILVGLVVVTTIASIFLYSNRKLQIRVIQVVMLINIGLLGAIFYYQKEAEKLAGAILHYKFGIIFPILSLVFLILAVRSIRQDEELVKAADRLR